MAGLDRNFTDELRARLSVVDVVGRVVPLTRKGQNYWGCCPFHNEKTPSFSVNEEKGFYHCFGCGEHGDIISFTMKHYNMDFVAAITELANMAGVKMPEYKPRNPDAVKHEEALFDICEQAAQVYQNKLFSDDGKHALEYIKNRGFDDDMIKKYRIGPMSLHGWSRLPYLFMTALLAVGGGNFIYRRSYCCGIFLDKKTTA